MPDVERKAAREAAKRAQSEAEVLARIAEMPAPFRAIGERLHRIIMQNAPGLEPRVRYGMPWYMREGKSWCFFRAAPQFGLMTLGFDDPAVLPLQEGASHRLVGSAYRITVLDEATETELARIVRNAAQS